MSCSDNRTIYLTLLWQSLLPTLHYHLQCLFGLGVGTSASSCFGGLLCRSELLSLATAFEFSACSLQPVLPDSMFFPDAPVASLSPDWPASSTLLPTVEWILTATNSMYEYCMITIGILHSPATRLSGVVLHFTCSFGFGFGFAYAFSVILLGSKVMCSVIILEGLAPECFRCEVAGCCAESGDFDLQILSPA